MVRKAKEEPLEEAKDEPFGLNGALWEGGRFERKGTLSEKLFSL